MDFEAVYADFLNALESIAEQYDELTDTDVRERLREVIEYYFVWNNEVDDRFPQKYAMFSAQADALVASAIRSFIEQAQQLVRDVEVGDDRNHLLENFDIETLSGAYFDEFIGSTDQAFEEQPPSSDDYYGNYND